MCIICSKQLRARQQLRHHHPKTVMHGKPQTLGKRASSANNPRTSASCAQCMVWVSRGKPAFLHGCPHPAPTSGSHGPAARPAPLCLHHIFPINCTVLTSRLSRDRGMCRTKQQGYLDRRALCSGQAGQRQQQERAHRLPRPRQRRKLRRAGAIPANYQIQSTGPQVGPAMTQCFSKF